MARKSGKNIVMRARRWRRALTSLGEAAETLKKAHYAKFDETVELVINLGVDPKHSDQMVRGTVVLPQWPGQIQARAGDRQRRKSSRGAGSRRRFRRRRRHGAENSGRLDGLRRRHRHAGHDAFRRAPR